LLNADFGPAPIRATRRVRQPRSFTGVTNSSYRRPVNSFDARDRAISPPVAPSRMPTADGPSPSNQGTARKSVSTAWSGAPVHVIGAEDVAEAIGLLSLKRLAPPSVRTYNQCSSVFPPVSKGLHHRSPAAHRGCR